MSERNYFARQALPVRRPAARPITPYSNAWVHPVIDYNYIVGAPVLGGELSFNAHARSMTRSDGTDTNRAVARGQLAAQDDRSHRPGVDALRATCAAMSSTTADAARSRRRWRRCPSDTVLRGVAAAGVLYSYPFVAHTASASHVFAPTAQIIVRQNKVDQRRLPDEDAKSLVFDDTLLFDIDKFSGYDRFETGTRANVGMQYTLQANNGVYARFVFGQSFQLAGENPYRRSGPRPDRQVLTIRRRSGLETNRSDYVAGLYLSPFAGLSLITQARFDERDWTPAAQRHDPAGPTMARCRARWPTPSRISILRPA